MAEDPKSILARPYARVLTPDPDAGGFTAEIREFPGCVTEGETVEEAMASLEEVALEWIAIAQRRGFAFPDPKEPELSGKFALRMPRSLHSRAARAAEREGISLNKFLCSALAEALGERKGAEAFLRLVREELRELPVLRHERGSGSATRSEDATISLTSTLDTLAETWGDPLPYTIRH